VKKDIDPQFFGFRWITLLLSQEFLLPGQYLEWLMLIVNVVMYAYHLEVIQIWDTFLADSNRFEFVIYVSCAMILSVKHAYIPYITQCIFACGVVYRCIKEELMKGDFGESILLLQVCVYVYYPYHSVCVCSSSYSRITHLTMWI